MARRWVVVGECECECECECEWAVGVALWVVLRIAIPFHCTMPCKCVRESKEWRLRRLFPFLRYTIIFWLTCHQQKWNEQHNKVAFDLRRHGKQVVKPKQSASCYSFNTISSIRWLGLFVVKYKEKYLTTYEWMNDRIDEMEWIISFKKWLTNKTWIRNSFTQATVSGVSWLIKPYIAKNGSSKLWIKFSWNIN